MKNSQLNVDPRILELLGPNPNIYYVLAELVANAYDKKKARGQNMTHLGTLVSIRTV